MKLTDLDYRELIKVLTFEITILSELFEGDKKYQRLLNILREYADIEQRLYQKDLIKILEMPRPKLMELLRGLYADFQSAVSNPGSYKISNTEFWLLAQSRTEYWVIGIDKLSHIPRVGDDFELWFAREKWGGCFFKVERVSHQIDNGTHRIHISLVDRWAAKEKSYGDDDF